MGDKPPPSGRPAPTKKATTPPPAPPGGKKETKEEIPTAAFGSAAERTAAARNIDAMKSFTIDMKELARQIQSWLNKGTQLKTVDVSKIALFRMPWTPEERALIDANREDEVIPRRPKDLMDCLNIGMKFFDAIVWLSLDDQSTVVMTDYDVDRANPFLDENTRLLNAIGMSKYIAVVFFHLLTRASYPSGMGTERGSDIPAFQIQLLDDRTSGDRICKSLANFELKDLSGEWIKYVMLGPLGKEFLNRLSLGVAGYRNIRPFAFYEPDHVDEEGKDDVSKEARDAAAWLKLVALAPYNWGIHPTTRSNDVVKMYGSINANAQNVMVKCYKTTTLEEMKENRMIYAVPKFNPTHIQWRVWNDMTPVPDDGEIFQ